ncbi:MAG TPA: hypothetical protein VGH60_02275 [Solirubrobacteraceae bacterium]
MPTVAGDPTTIRPAVIGDGKEKIHMREKLKGIGVLAVASVAIMIAGAPAANAETCAAVQGAGSSLQNIAQKEVWMPGFASAVTLCAANPLVTYNSTSSGRGKAQWGYEGGGLKLKESGETSFPAFIGTDLAPDAGQITNMGAAGEQPTHSEGVLTVPVAQSAISVIVSLPTDCRPKSPSKEAEIEPTLLKEEWEKDLLTILQYVKNVECTGSDSAAILLEARSSNSGTTAGFKRYLDLVAAGAAPWNELTETPLKAEEPNWPSEAEKTHLDKCCTKGSEVASTVLNTPNSSGYADLADARHEGFTTKWVDHLNAAKELYLSAIALVKSNTEFESPEETSGGSNCKNATYNEETRVVKPGADWSTAQQTNIKTNKAYPICTLTFDLAWNKYDTPALVSQYGTLAVTEETRNTVRNYLEWVTSGGQSATLKSDHYGELPAGIKTKDKEAFTTLGLYIK